jgi:G:T/U-mismatch repair DNA glycosylase
MVSTRYLLDHIEALLRLSHDARDPVISAKIREMADELRILISVADVTDFAATLNSTSPVAGPVSNEIVTALYGTKPKRKRRAKEGASGAPTSKPKRAKKGIDE